MSENYLNCAGTFEAVVTKPAGGWLQKSKDKGTPYICIPVEVTGDDVDSGKTIVWNGWLSDKAFERTIETLIQVFGFNGDLTGLHKGEITFEGMPCQVTTEVQEYNGKNYGKVKFLNKAGYVHETPRLAEDEATRLLASMSGRAKKVALAAKAGTAKTPVTSPATRTSQDANPPVEDDDVPF